MKANITLNSLTIEGNTNHDLAYDIWYNKLSPVKRYEISSMFSEYTNNAYKLRASLNYIAENIEKFN